MRTVVLARHGPPAWDFSTPIPGTALTEWMRGLDAAPLIRGRAPPIALRKLADRSRLIVASPLRRSLESAATLAPGGSPLVNAVFQEVSLPTAIRSSVRLPPRVWKLLARMAWYAGWSPEVEGLGQALHRAATAAVLLDRLAADHGQILLAGHGMLNGLIGVRLRSMGWRGPWFRPRRYWAVAVYTQRPTASPPH